MRRIGSLPVLCLAFVLSGCFATSGPSVPNQVSLGDGAYAVVFTDSLESAGAIQVLSSEGAGLSTTQLHAEDLLTRTDGPQGAVLLGARCADLVTINRDGTTGSGRLDFPEGTWVTASVALDDSTLLSTVNVGQEDDGYHNPIILHDAQGKVSCALSLIGYIQSITVTDHGVALAGTSLNGDPLVDEDGSVLVIVDPQEHAITAEYRWTDVAGLTQCQANDDTLWCFENEPVGDGTDPGPQGAVRLVSINLTTGSKKLVTTMGTPGIALAQAGDGRLVFTEQGVKTLDQAIAGDSGRRLVATADEIVERVTVTDGLVDVFVRDLARQPVGDGVQIGRIVRLDPASLETLRETPLVIPDQEAVNVHVFPREFFTP